MPEDRTTAEPNFGYLADYKFADESDDGGSDSGDSSPGSLDGDSKFPFFSEDEDPEAAAFPTASRGPRANLSEFKFTSVSEDESEEEEPAAVPTAALIGSLRRSAVTSYDPTLISRFQSIDRLTLETGGRDWLHSFRDLDPRLQILQFFNDLALDGVESFESNGCLAGSPLLLPQILRGFIRCGIFSVWRPTSNDAIRMMMTGEGTGKGLDIKGKSAKRGKYSGFVPFLQIDCNDHKKKVGSMRADKRVRVFYPNKSSRDTAASVLNILGDSMTHKAATAEMKIKEEERRTAKMTKLATAGPSTGSRRMTMYRLGDIGGSLAISQAYLMEDPTIYKIDDYSLTQGVYGIDIPEKLFWEGYIVPNDISRDSETLTGRPSMPEFQKMNIDTLRKGSDMGHARSDERASADADPRPVLWHGDCGRPGEDALRHCNPMSPIGLLMAYEENDRVTPVVSDFDCFLLGTRNVKYEKPLGECERSILSWCVNEIEGILETPIDGISWTRRWLEVKKRHVEDPLHHGMPKFGYADPRSYSIMKGAVHKLTSNGTGAVRHGPECFNYGFPQELDDRYLVISDTFSGVPWRYTDASGLLDILCDKIKLGFTFPLNPKWILCDPGWKRVYDQLMASTKPRVQDSMDVWYPSDIRDQIDKISRKYPQGFVNTSGDQDHSSGVRTDLAKLELKRYMTLKSSQRKLRAAVSKKNLVSEFVRISEELEARKMDTINEIVEKEPRQVQHQRRKSGVKEKVARFLARRSGIFVRSSQSNMLAVGEESNNLAQSDSNNEDDKSTDQSLLQTSMPRSQGVSMFHSLHRSLNRRRSL